MKVIDLSHYNAKVDFLKFRDVGIEGAVIRLGYRGYSKGIIVKDGKFDEIWRLGEGAGFKLGVYFVTQAINEKEAVEETDWVCREVKNLYPFFPIIVDTEESGNGTGRASSKNLSKEKRTKVVKSFCEEVERRGFKAGVYANESWFKSQLDLEQLKKWYIWVANYSAEPKIYYDAWQYTEKARIKGCDNYFFDMSHFNNLKKSDEEIADEVIAGLWGNGADRKIRLTGAGYNYQTIQKIVNVKLQPKKDCVGMTYIIKKGDTLSSIATRFSTTVEKLIVWNDIKDPNKIVAGKTIIVR